MVSGFTTKHEVVLMGSPKEFRNFPRLLRTRADGTGSPVVLPPPSAVSGACSADGNTLVYVPVAQYRTAAMGATSS
jgi:hypothetical protein